MIDLFRSDNVLVRSVPAEDVSRWVVTFDNYGIGQGFDRLGFGEAFLRKVGVSAIHVMGCREDWYQYPEMAEAMAVVRGATAGAHRVMTYGSSMGGYAAIRFADAVGADAVLALSPQYSIDPLKVPFETRWRQEAERIEWRPEIDGAINCACAPIIVFDPLGVDGRHVDLIAAETAVQRFPLRYSGHPSTTFLSELGLLEPLALQALSGELDVEAFRAEALRQKAQCPAYLSRLAELQPAWRAGLALDLARRACALGPTNHAALATLAALQSRSGDHDQALANYNTLSNVTDRAPNYLVLHAQALADAGRLEDACVLAREVVEAQPDAANLWAWLAHIEWRLGAHDAAMAAIERAIRLFPTQAEYQAQREQYLICRPVEREAPPPKGLVRVLRAAKRRLG